MPPRTPRRQFLKAAGLTAIAGAEFALPRAVLADDSALAEKAKGEARLLPGCCAYSYLKELDAHQMTMEDFILKGVELGVTGVDITAYWLTSTEPAYLTNLRHLAFKNGLPFSGAACGASMVQPTAEKRAEAIEEIKKWVDATQWLGASHLRIFAGRKPQDATVAQAVDWTVEAMKQACNYSAKKGITLGVEDHDGITQTAEVCLEIMHRVNSPYAGINLDISHFIPSPGHDGYSQIEATVPYATHTHIHGEFDAGDPIDLDRVWSIFAKAGYKGYMSAEYESEGKEDPLTAVPKFIAKIRALCKKYSSV
jgi:sugar phosphate isomerase/epimerase